MPVAADDGNKEDVCNNVHIKKAPAVESHKLTFTLEILHIIKDAQQQHGLRHSDYQRYRSYCSRRVRRLRKSLHFVQGTKHRFQGKKVSDDVVTDIRFLYIPLMTAERAWGYAMQLKQEANTEPRKRFHLVSRMRKAVKEAGALEALCEGPKCDARTKLEAQAYSAWMKGSLFFEVQQWQKAMEYFGISQTIYEKLSQALSDDEKVLYKQKVEELTPNIRYCAYNIGDETAINDLMQMRLSGKAAGENILAAELDHLIAQTREKQAVTLSEIEWLGRKIPVRQEKVRVFLLNVQETKTEIEKALTYEAKIALCEKLLLECKDAVQSVRDEMKVDQASKVKSEAAQSSLSLLHTYLTYIRLAKTVDRNVLMIESLKQNLQPSDGGSDGKKQTKPQDLVRPYEIMIQNLQEMTQLPGIEQHSAFVEDTKSQILAYKAYRCYYIAQVYSTVNKWAEAMALYGRAEEYLKQPLTDNSLTDKKLLRNLQELKVQMEKEKYSAYSSSILNDNDTGESSVPQAVDKILMERLDTYYEDPKLTSRQPLIAQFPPEFKPIPCKPLFFDLALNQVEFLPLDDRVEKKAGGLTGLVRGWLGGWK